ncbi:uncharacterized protein CLUP02_00377 [Colletotrichum lupini]|uniref:Uncharacterized protein n=1 Tax=Colletotrichum lupini TaxID=145971 RepID=A0A9Q8W889_9PEZI|nr:uncharacterized protein CLUP02_00377 [Colletotrichum lupini]UQC73731.1 hypothetical protein CLUP02_00377 [Colletotrichum lupini]
MFNNFRKHNFDLTNGPGERQGRTASTSRNVRRKRKDSLEGSRRPHRSGQLPRPGKTKRNVWRDPMRTSGAASARNLACVLAPEELRPEPASVKMRDLSLAWTVLFGHASTLPDSLGSPSRVSAYMGYAACYARREMLLIRKVSR